jgi:hypothetical protein
MSQVRVRDAADPGGSARRGIDARVAGALILAIVGILFWFGVHVVVPATADRPVTIVWFGVVVGAIGLLVLASPRAAIVALLVLAPGWRLTEPWLQGVVRPWFGAAGGTLVGGADVIETYTPLLVLAASFALAVWLRPPGRTPDGGRVLATRVVNRVALPAILLGPPLGLVAWLGFAPGDVYGRPLSVGLLVGGAGLLTFIGYAGMYRLASRPGVAAALGAAWALVTLALFLVL